MRSRWLLLAGLIGIAACQDSKTEPKGGAKGDPYPLKGAAGTGPGPADAPFVRGAIVLPNNWTEERLSAGFAGQGADGKPHSNMAGTSFTAESGGFAESGTFKPQMTRIEKEQHGGLFYWHTHLPPGDYVVYVTRNRVPAAWQKVTVKAGDQQTVDLTIDPAKAGELTVTLAAPDPKEPAFTPLHLIPAGIDLPGSSWHDAFQAGEFEAKEPVMTFQGVPAGKYRVVRGRALAEVEVVAGKKAAVTLVRQEPNNK